MKSIAFFTILFLAMTCYGQGLDSIRLSGKYLERASIVEGRPVFELKLTNTANHPVYIPKQYIATTKPYPTANVRAEIKCELKDSITYNVLACNIDPEFEIDSQGKVSLGRILLNPQESYSKIINISCVSFRVLKNRDFKVRFALDPDKTNLKCETQWIYFKLK